ncbi:MAG: hypothetical protein JNM68_13760, partial [Dinghuibacter sp.]|nr:hypothetical protein [Dinghuibacter sp.]
MQTGTIKYYLVFFLLFHTAYPGFAQNGTGALYLYNFGQGGLNPNQLGPPLPPGRTELPYSNSECPVAGAYTIIRRVPVNNCFNGEWIELTHDNDNLVMDYGMMMLVNNNPATGNRVVYCDTINTSFCTTTTYRYSFAVINVDKPGTCNLGPDFPSLEYRISTGSGQLIKKDTTRPNVSYASTPYKFSIYNIDFTVPPGVNAIIPKLTLLNLSYLCAEDFAIDDIRVAAVGPEATINFTNEPPSNIVQSVCFQHNRTISITGNVGPYYNNTSLQWQQSTDSGSTWNDIPGATNIVYTRVCSIPGTFFFRLTAAEGSNITNTGCRVFSNALRVNVDGIPQGYNITSNSPVCAGSELKFNASGAASYIWTGPNGFYDNIPYPSINPTTLSDSGWYKVEVKSLGGCVKNDSIHVRIIGTNVRTIPDTAICAGASVRLNVITPGVSYLWSPPEGLSAISNRTPLATPKATTTYTVKLTDRFGCADTAQVTITVKNKIPVKAQFSSADYICPAPDSIKFTDESAGAIRTWNWAFGNGSFSSSRSPAVQYYTIAPGTD